MRIWVVLSFMTLVVGCSTTAQRGTQASDVLALMEGPLFLNSEDHGKRVDRFVNNKDNFSEQDKINYLLSCVRDSKAIFIRNGQQHNGFLAAQWLRWKMQHPQYRKNPIQTARRFVDEVCLRSNKTGIPYFVILQGSQRKALQEVMNHELTALEGAIRDKLLKANVPAEMKPVDKQQEETKIPLILPAAK